MWRRRIMRARPWTGLFHSYWRGTPRIVIPGASSIGYVGGYLALAGRDVTLLLRPALAEIIAGHGLPISDLDGADRMLAPRPSSSRPPRRRLAGAGHHLRTVKSSATAPWPIDRRACSSGATVAGLQNSVGNVDVLLARLGAWARVVAGMVAFDVVPNMRSDSPRTFIAVPAARSASGPACRACAALDVPGRGSEAYADMTGGLGEAAVQFDDALNALSGVPSSSARRPPLAALLAAQIGEALGVLKAAGIRPARIEGVSPARSRVLRAPDRLFRRVARRMLAIDPGARSSMWEDLGAAAGDRDRLSAGRHPGLAHRSGMRARLTERIITSTQAGPQARARAACRRMRSRARMDAAAADEPGRIQEWTRTSSWSAAGLPALSRARNRCRQTRHPGRSGGRAKPRRPGLLVVRRIVPGRLAPSSAGSASRTVTISRCRTGWARRASTATRISGRGAGPKPMSAFAAGEKRGWLRAMGHRIFPDGRLGRARRL